MKKRDTHKKMPKRRLISRSWSNAWESFAAVVVDEINTRKVMNSRKWMR